MAEDSRRKVPKVLIAAAASVFVVVLGAFLYARGGGPVPAWFPFSAAVADPLAASGPEEVVLRTVRLAGFEHAVAGADRDGAVARIAIPAVSSAADVEIAWQSGVAALTEAYPRSGRYVVQIFEGESALLEVAWDREEARQEVESNDPDALRSSAEFVYLSGDIAVGAGASVGGVADDSAGLFGYIIRGLTGKRETPSLAVPDELAKAARRLYGAQPEDAVALPGDSLAVDVHVAGNYLDAKNRAAGLLGVDGGYVGPLEGGQRLEELARQMRDAVPGIPAVPVDRDAALVWRERATVLLEDQRQVAGVETLLQELARVEPGASREAVVRLRTWYHVATATGSDAFGATLGAAADSARSVRETPIGADAFGDAVLVAADVPDAPSGMLAVSRFERERSSDATSSPDGEMLPNRALAAAGTLGQDGLGLTVATVDGPRRYAPDVWPAYRRADGAVFWLAGEGAEAALTDGSVRGWAFSVERAALVDADRCGRWLAVFPTGVTR